MRRTRVYAGFVGSLIVVSLFALITSCSGGGDDAGAAGRLQEGLDAHYQGNLRDAEVAYQDVLETEPTNTFALYDLGVVQHNTNRLAEAEQNYRKALDMDPNFSPAAYNLALLRAAAGATDEAIQLHDRVIVLDANNAGAHYNRGLLLQQQGQSYAAAQAFAQATQLDPNLVPPDAQAEVESGREPEEAPADDRTADR